jgi:hypothetical protein
MILKLPKGESLVDLPIEVSHTKISEGIVKHVESRCLSQRRWIILFIRQERPGMGFLKEVNSSAEKLRAGPSQSAIRAPVNEA